MATLITILPGDGIGPEVALAGRQVLERVAERHGHDFRFEEHLVGGVAIDETGVPLPLDTVASCADSAAEWVRTRSRKPENSSIGAKSKFTIAALSYPRYGVLPAHG